MNTSSYPSDLTDAGCRVPGATAEMSSSQQCSSRSCPAIDRSDSLPAMDQPHRKRVKHFYEPGDVHELTFSCYQRRPLLTNDPWQADLAETIDRANRRHAFGLLAYVFVPEHIH